MAKDTIASLRHSLDTLSFSFNQRLVALEGKVDAPAQSDTFKMLDRMLQAMHDERKIEAIKECRALTGYGLKESKDLIEKHWSIFHR